VFLRLLRDAREDRFEDAATTEPTKAAVEHAFTTAHEEARGGACLLSTVVLGCACCVGLAAPKAAKASTPGAAVLKAAAMAAMSTAARAAAQTKS